MVEHVGWRRLNSTKISQKMLTVIKNNFCVTIEEEEGGKYLIEEREEYLGVPKLLCFLIEQILKNKVPT